MAKNLSQDEIDALMTVAARASGSDAPDQPSSSVVRYNFRRPDRVTKDQMRSLHFLHDRFARNVSTSMSAYLRVVTEVSIISVEQFTYSEFLMSLSDPTAFYAVSMRPLEGVAALELNPAVAFTMIDRMLGGSGRGVMVNRALTEIEQNVTDGLVNFTYHGWQPSLVRHAIAVEDVQWAARLLGALSDRQWQDAAAECGRTPRPCRPRQRGTHRRGQTGRAPRRAKYLRGRRAAGPIGGSAARPAVSSEGALSARPAYDGRR